MAPNTEPLEHYLKLFDSLHRNRDDRKGYAPHKPIFLLALLDEIECGRIRENKVVVTPELLASFRAYWRALVPKGTWVERMVYPFRYLIQDGFWELCRDGQTLSPVALGDPTSLGQLLVSVDEGRFTPDLWSLLQDKAAVDALRSRLLTTYFRRTTADVQALLPAEPVDYEVQQLMRQAKARFHANKVHEKQDDGYYVRHALFPRVVNGLYGHRCAVCGIGTRARPSGAIVDAVHILPFAQFHNDDPRNGISLCKNHHWGFDRGWFGVDDGFKLIASPRVVSASKYIEQGSHVRLPADRQYAPALEALMWHRENVFLQ